MEKVIVVASWNILQGVFNEELVWGSFYKSIDDVILRLCSLYTLMTAINDRSATGVQKTTVLLPGLRRAQTP